MCYVVTLTHRRLFCALSTVQDTSKNASLLSLMVSWPAQSALTSGSRPTRTGPWPAAMLHFLSRVACSHYIKSSWLVRRLERSRPVRTEVCFLTRLHVGFLKQEVGDVTSCSNQLQAPAMLSVTAISATQCCIVLIVCMRIADWLLTDCLTDWLTNKPNDPVGNSIGQSPSEANRCSDIQDPAQYLWQLWAHCCVANSPQLFLPSATLPQSTRCNITHPSIYC